MARPRSKLTEKQVAEILAAPAGTVGAELARKYGVSRAYISEILRRKRQPRVVTAPISTIAATGSRPAAFSMRLADTADSLLDDIERARAEVASSDDLKFRATQASVLARSLRDLAEAKESLMKGGLPGMTKQELRNALEERAKGEST